MKIIAALLLTTTAAVAQERPPDPVVFTLNDQERVVVLNALDGLKALKGADDPSLVMRIDGVKRSLTSGALITSRQAAIIGNSLSWMSKDPAVCTVVLKLGGRCSD